MNMPTIAGLGTLAAFALLTTACAHQPTLPENAHPDLRTTVIPTAEWERVIRPGFSFDLPPGFQRLDLQPIDSDAATYVRGGASLHYDFGPYSGKPSVDGAQALTQNLSIGGRTAYVVTYRRDDGRWVVAAWWESVSRGPTGENSLVMQADFVDAADREELLASIYSVRFE